MNIAVTFLAFWLFGVVSSDSNQNLETWLGDVTFVIHRNGEPDPCGTAKFQQSKNLQDLARTNDKYQMESVLTDLVAENLLDQSSCGSPDNATAPESLHGFCDMGKDRTPIFMDHSKLVRVKEGSLPCSWYTREGARISSLNQLRSLVEQGKQSTPKACANPQEDGCGNAGTEVHLYGVQAGRVFMFAPAYVGEVFDLSHLMMRPDPEKAIYMTVLSTNPRVFDIVNIFSREEADEVVARALAETSETYGLHRSTTGSNENSIFSKRTSENGFDTHGRTAMKIKKRIFELLGFDQFWNGLDDGLQVLRYNQTKAYVQHMDYLTDNSGTQLYNYDSAGKGGNRFATVLLYMNDMEEGAGGELVFSEAWPTDLEKGQRKKKQDAIADLRASGDAEAAGIEEGSWEEKLVALCRSRLAVRPTHGRAVLFYSQFPNGAPDPMSKHGGCPVLKGQKWAANMWVWNLPRSENMELAPLREDLLAKGHKTPQSNMPKQLHATFINGGKDPRLKEAELWFDEAMFWGKLGHGDPPLYTNTYEGHKWNIRVDGEIVREFVIGGDKRQRFEI